MFSLLKRFWVLESWMVLVIGKTHGFTSSLEAELLTKPAAPSLCQFQTVTSECDRTGVAP